MYIYKNFLHGILSLLLTDPLKNLKRHNKNIRTFLPSIKNYRDETQLTE